VWLGEGLGSYGWPASSSWQWHIAAGVRAGRALERFDARSVGFALLTSLTITTYAG
jgi:hypothetical protein